MVLYHEYLADVKEYLADLDENILCALNNKKEAVTEEVVEQIWYNYQKMVTEYGCDASWALPEAIENVLGIRIPSHHIGGI